MAEELELMITIDEESYQEALKKIMVLKHNAEINKHLYFLYGFLSGIVFMLSALVLFSLS